MLKAMNLGGKNLFRGQKSNFFVIVQKTLDDGDGLADDARIETENRFAIDSSAHRRSKYVATYASM
jgi:hypothetical protein